MSRARARAAAYTRFDVQSKCGLIAISYATVSTLSLRRRLRLLLRRRRRTRTLRVYATPSSSRRALPT